MNQFWINFWANLFADLLAGAVIVLILTYFFIDKRLKRLEERSYLQTMLEELALHYLRLVRDVLPNYRKPGKYAYAVFDLSAYKSALAAGILGSAIEDPVLRLNIMNVFSIMDEINLVLEHMHQFNTNPAMGKEAVDNMSAKNVQFVVQNLEAAERELREFFEELLPTELLGEGVSIVLAKIDEL